VHARIVVLKDVVVVMIAVVEVQELMAMIFVVAVKPAYNFHTKLFYVQHSKVEK
jgi:capsular polysaccharide biosynthesis protein